MLKKTVKPQSISLTQKENMSKKFINHIIAAQPNWFVYEACSSDETISSGDLILTPIIAWAIQIEASPTDQRGEPWINQHEVEPITIDGVQERDFLIFKRPDGIISEPAGVLEMTTEDVVKRFQEHAERSMREILAAQRPTEPK